MDISDDEHDLEDGGNNDDDGNSGSNDELSRSSSTLPLPRGSGCWKKTQK
jgi:hypothetical protein